MSAVKPIDSQALISKTPFVPPATRPTGPVEVPVVVEVAAKQHKVDDKDKKKKTPKSRKHNKPDHDYKPSKPPGRNPDPKSEKKRDRSPSPVRKQSSAKGCSHSPPVVASTGPESAKQPATKKGDSSRFASDPDVVTGSTVHPSTTSLHTGHGQPSTGACAFPPDTDIEHYGQFSDDPMDQSDSNSGSGEEEGQLSHSNDTPEQTEDMSYRETIRSVRSFMGWHHSLLYDCLHDWFGLDGTVLSWIKSYLSNRKQKIKIGDSFSEAVILPFGVPQGSVLGPLLFTLYTSPLSQVISKFKVTHHLYADDTQIYLAVDSRNFDSSMEELTECLKSVEEWMEGVKLKLNPEKPNLSL